MKRYNVYFEYDKDVEIGVVVETDFDYETEREFIIFEAQKKLSDKKLDKFLNLKCTEVNFLEEV